MGWRGIYSTYEASYFSPIYMILLGLGTLALGLMLLRRYHRNLLD